MPPKDRQCIDALDRVDRLHPLHDPEPGPDHAQDLKSVVCPASHLYAFSYPSPDVGPSIRPQRTTAWNRCRTSGMPCASHWDTLDRSENHVRSGLRRVWSSVEPSPSKRPAAHAKRCSWVEAAEPASDRLSRLGLVGVRYRGRIVPYCLRNRTNASAAWARLTVPRFVQRSAITACTSSKLPARH